MVSSTIVWGVLSWIYGFVGRGIERVLRFIRGISEFLKDWGAIRELFFGKFDTSLGKTRGF